MKLEIFEKALAEACDRVREALQEPDAASAPVGCAVAVFTGKTAIVGSSGAVDCRPLTSRPGAGPVRFELEPGETVELLPRFTADEEVAGKRIASTDETGRLAVAQRVLDTAEELEALIERKARSTPGSPRAPRSSDDDRQRVAEQVLQTAAELEALIKGARNARGEAPVESLQPEDAVTKASNDVLLKMEAPLTGPLADDVVKVMSDWPLWSALTATEKGKLARLMRVVSVEAGTQPPLDGALMLVRTGLLAQRLPDRVQELMQGAAVYLEVFAGADPHGPIVVTRDATLFVADRDAVLALLNEAPGLSAKLGWCVARELAIHHGPFRNPFERG